ncbi:MAG: hypothetical protein KF729_34145 [Sandaracinaceae bacterium]|nr:hypothetical protein [Sandaracinaceae bacterium]
MRQITFSVVADGGTDRALLPVLTWAIHRLDPDVEILEPGFVKRRGSVKECLSGLVTGAQLVFVHRDAESESLEARLREFEEVERDDVVPVIPVRMTEAWLLIDGAAIARAAGHPSVELKLPSVAALERLPDPKGTLEELLLQAAGDPTGRRRKKFLASLAERRVNVAEFVRNFSPLEKLEAFVRFQRTLSARYPYREQLRR